MTVGIRPEHLQPCEAGEAALSGPVEMVEMLGADMLLHVGHGAHTVLARVPHGAQPALGSTMHFHIPPGTVFLFDAQGGARVP